MARSEGLTSMPCSARPGGLRVAKGVGTILESFEGMWRRAFIIPSIALCACGDDPPPGITSRLALTAFDSCDSLETYVQDQAVRQMRAQLEPRTHEGGLVRVFEGNDTSIAPRASGPDSFTRTNTQERGVDEPDFVKTDGAHIYVISGPNLHIVRSWPADALAKLAQIQIEGVPRELFLEEDADRVTVLSGVPAGLTGGPRNGPYNGYADMAAPRCVDFGCGDTGATKVTVIDVSNPAVPSITGEVYLPGIYRSARRVGSAMRLVLGDDVVWPNGVKWWLEGSSSGFLGDLFGNDDEYEDLMDDNEDVIRSTPLASWLPQASRRLPDGSVEKLEYECSNFASTNAPVYLGLTNVVSIDLSNPNGLTATTIVTQPGEIYATESNLYVSTPHFWWTEAAGQQGYTYVFKVQGSGGALELRAAGGVEGVLLDQFSMSEHEGNLRVATTIDRLVESGDFLSNETTNRVTVLGPDLTLLGRTEEIAKGERIYSARFVGARGFVVTFRQIDPLFTIDLSTPTDPRVIGELKVPGFSTYLHPLGDDHLLAIGVHVPEGGFERTVKLTLFDVSSFANPVEAFTTIVGTNSGTSEALDDHRAFTWFAEKGLLAIPYSDWSGSPQGFSSEVRVYGVDVADGFSFKGALSMNDVYAGVELWQSWYAPYARRSILADDFVYAISDVAIRSASLSSLSTPIATVILE
ncbi:MAG: beta-propeller domain-containing protein [Deltaproteobacteria bacterium]|nr:beta-propeller domain-containing protein [Deltaproteobacteria bacterium]